MKENNVWWIILIVGGFLFGIFSSGASDDVYTDYEFKKIEMPKSLVLYLDVYNASNFSHWGHMPLTYKIENNCVDRQIELIELAFEKIKEETSDIVWFENSSTNPDISIYCKPQEYSRYGDTTIADALITDIDTSNNLIKKGELNFYGQGAVCLTGYPALEVHEILHLLDIPHNPLVNSVMSPFSAETSKECKIKKIDKEYISCLKFVYSNGEFGEECYFPNFINENKEDYEYVCDDGWYFTEDNESCCPEPDMMIDEDGYCSYSDYEYVEEYEYVCDEGWYPSIGDGDYCCPEPDMRIGILGYCK